MFREVVSRCYLKKMTSMENLLSLVLHFQKKNNDEIISMYQINIKLFVWDAYEEYVKCPSVPWALPECAFAS